MAIALFWNTRRLDGTPFLVAYEELLREYGTDYEKVRHEQIEQEERRYELYDGEQLLASEIHSGQTRWYFRNELLWMLQLAGFQEVTVKGDYTDEPFNASHKTTMVFLATKSK